MIHYDGWVSDSIGANAALSAIFDQDDLIQEVAYQILAEKWIYGKSVLG